MKDCVDKLRAADTKKIFAAPVPPLPAAFLVAGFTLVYR